MKNFIMKVLFVLVLLSPVSAFAFGEEFNVTLTGKEYCADDYNFGTNFTYTTQVIIQDEYNLLVYLSSYGGWWADFQATTPGSKYNFIITDPIDILGGAVEEVAYGAIIGKYQLNKDGSIKNVNGNFLQDSLFRPGCFSVGKFKTGTRIF